MRIVREKFDEKKRLSDESLFSCGSGILGVRGNFEEGNPLDTITIRGTYLNGFCESEEINYNEKLCGFPEEKQTIVNLPDGQGIEFYVDGEKITCWSDKANDFNYVLDMESGTVNRTFVYDTKYGKLEFSFTRFTSFNRTGLFTIRVLVKSLGFNGEIKLKTLLNGDVKNFTVNNDPRVASGSGKMLKVNYALNKAIDGLNYQQVEVETLRSKRKVVASCLNKLSCGELNYDVNESLLIGEASINLNENETFNFEKYCFYNDLNNPKDDIKQLKEAYTLGFDKLFAEQKDYMSKFWNASRVLVDSNKIKQEHLDFCLYVMLESAGNDGLTSVAAKGLSGEGYEGHYFWDCETYVFPFFVVTNPEIAKSLLMYRYSKLDKAKQHAKSLGHKKGALYPWRTITGSECSSYYPSGSAQYHINGDIARAFYQYYEVTQDKKMLPIICEVLVETSRLWMDLGHYSDDKFKIDCVTGPDEYTCLVNNNYYTNAGAASNMHYAYKLVSILKETEFYKDFVKKTDISDDELNSFKEASLKMYYPYDGNLGIIKQDDSFLDKAKVDLNSFEKSEFPLLLNYHPLYLYRHQICKQADAVLADYLFGGLDATTSKKTFDYYEACTTHDSSLSKAIFGIVAAKLGDLNKACQYFEETLSTDIEDEKGNTRDGLHVANMGGCYHMITGGFAGLRINEDNLSLFPLVPDDINSYSFNLFYKGKEFNVFVDNNGTKLTCLDTSNPIEITVYGQKVILNKKEISVTRKAKAVIFDLDGVITDTAVFHYQAWKKIADELNISFDEKRNEDFKGVSRSKCLELLLKWGNKNVNDDEFNELLNRKNEYYKEFLKTLTPDNILPGVMDCLKSLRKQGIKIALFSVSKNTMTILDKLKIEDAFDAIVSGNDVKNSKPHFEGYLLAADRLNIDPRLCVMVEDSEAGISGAKALCLKTLAIMKENKANADICIDSTSKLSIINELL